MIFMSPAVPVVVPVVNSQHPQRPNQDALGLVLIEHEVVVHVEDFEYAGQRYKSISRISKMITGTN